MNAFPLCTANNGLSDFNLLTGNMRFKSLSTVALAGAAVASPVATINARNTTTPCGAITALYKQYYSDPKSRSCLQITI
jgi:hypothetical protein